MNWVGESKVIWLNNLDLVVLLNKLLYRLDLLILDVFPVHFAFSLTT